MEEKSDDQSMKDVSTTNSKQNYDGDDDDGNDSDDDVMLTDQYDENGKVITTNTGESQILCQ